nr:hypothetical protein [Mycobacterium europaeum]
MLWVGQPCIYASPEEVHGDPFGEELAAWLREPLAHYKCPRSISFEAQLPRTNAGKLYKGELVRRTALSRTLTGAGHHRLRSSFR